MNERDKNSERRKQARAERTGTNNFVCITCGWTDDCAVEKHHVGGKRYDRHTEDICVRCHKHLSDAQRSHPAPIGQNPSITECAAHYILGIADIFALRVRVSEDYGHRLVRAAIANPKVMPDCELRALILKVGYFLIASSAMDNRTTPRLRYHADCLIDETRKSTPATIIAKDRKREGFAVKHHRRKIR